MSEERGPNYDWKHEAESLKKRVEELEMKLRAAQAEAEDLAWQKERYEAVKFMCVCGEINARNCPVHQQDSNKIDTNKKEPTLNTHPPTEDGSDEAW